MGLLPLAAIAQEASPQPIRSLTRAQVWDEILAAFPMEEPQHRGGQVIHATADISTLNGLFAADSASYAVTDRVYESLVDISPIDAQPVPELADWWDLAPDGITYTFHLNPDARWQDGTDLTAADIVFTFAAALDPETGYLGQPDLAATIASYRAVDDDTFELISRGPLADVLWAIRYVTILPKHLWEDVPHAQWVSDPGSTGADLSRVVGTGPFTLVEWVPGDHARLRRNDAYYGNVPIIDEFVVAVYSEDASSLEALKAGEIDIRELVPAARVSEVEATEGLAVAAGDTPGFAYYMPNLDPEKTTLFQDRRVREALFVALDRAALVDAVLLGYGDVARGTQPPLSPAYAPERIAPAYDYDPARARQLLTEAGWSDSDGDGVVDKDGQAFAFELLYPNPSPAAPQIATYMQEAWRAIGVAVTPQETPWPPLLEATFVTHDFEMVLGGLYAEPSGSQGFLFRCDAYAGGSNAMKYCNPGYDELDEQQRRELDPVKRRELLIQQTNIVWQDLPLGVLAFFDDTTGYATRLHNIFPTGWGGPLWSLPWVWVDE